MFETGDCVRMKADPGRQGFITENTNEIGDILLYEVRFPDRKKFHPCDQLELLEQQLEPLDALKNGVLGKALDLRRNITYHRLNSRLDNLIYSMKATNTDFYAYQFKHRASKTPKKLSSVFGLDFLDFRCQVSLSG